MRLPLPAAGITAQTGTLLPITDFSLLRDQLDEGFSLLDHTEVVTCLFFESVEAVLQI
jgi:hypothetical protein